MTLQEKFDLLLIQKRKEETKKKPIYIQNVIISKKDMNKLSNKNVYVI